MHIYTYTYIHIIYIYIYIYTHTNTGGMLLVYPCNSDGVVKDGIHMIRSLLTVCRNALGPSGAE